MSHPDGSLVLRRAVLLLLLCGCQGRDDWVQVRFFEIDGEGVARADRRVIEAIARDTVAEARRALPQLPRPLVLRVQPGHDVMPETGASGTASQPNTVHWTVDPRRPEGVQQVARTWLRTCLFHELHHLVRGAAVASDRGSMLDIAITEGLATAFERDATQVVPPWGQYPAEAAAWVEELRDLPVHADNRRRWQSRHPDGRRWIAYKAGTYVVDRAARASGRSPAALVTTPAAEILRLATDPGPN